MKATNSHYQTVDSEDAWIKCSCGWGGIVGDMDSSEDGEDLVCPSCGGAGWEYE